MSPEVIDLKKIAEGGEVSPPLYFVVDFSSEVGFNEKEFDRLTAIVGDSRYGAYFCKFICADDKMYVFSAETDHIVFFELENLTKESLQCAGKIAIPVGKGKRMLGEYSRTLADEFILDMGKSHIYKMGPLSEKLEKFFEID